MVAYTFNPTLRSLEVKVSSEVVVSLMSTKPKQLETDKTVVGFAPIPPPTPRTAQLSLRRERKWTVSSVLALRGAA